MIHIELNQIQVQIYYNNNNNKYASPASLIMTIYNPCIIAS